jgi:sugar phosphate isomerase/epimerase
MVSRRSFLAITGAAAAGLAAGCRAGTTPGAAGPSTSAAPVRLDRIGVQLYTVRDQMEKDFAGTLERVARIGFKEVEFAGYYNRPPQEVRALLDRLGLAAPSSHIGLDVLQKDLPGQIQAARTIGHEYVTVPALMEPLMGRPVAADYWQRTAAEFNRIARALKAEGVGFAYHNHSFEFDPLADGRTGFDVLLAETDPALVQFELDLFWATFAGRDPVEMFRKHPGRYVMWHVKDMRGVAEARREAAAATGSSMQKMQGASKRLAAVGTGEIDFRRIFAQASTAGLRHFFVENDAAPTTASSLSDIETSFRNLQRILG